jgi:hypothetical protein
LIDLNYRYIYANDLAGHCFTRASPTARSTAQLLPPTSILRRNYVEGTTAQTVSDDDTATVQSYQYLQHKRSSSGANKTTRAAASPSLTIHLSLSLSLLSIFLSLASLFILFSCLSPLSLSVSLQNSTPCVSSLVSLFFCLSPFLFLSLSL